MNEHAHCTKCNSIMDFITDRTGNHRVEPCPVCTSDPVAAAIEQGFADLIGVVREAEYLNLMQPHAMKNRIAAIDAFREGGKP